MSILIGGVVLYAIVLVCAYFAQTSLIFHPTRLGKDFAFGAGAEEVFMKTRDGEDINGLFFAGASKEVIIYFHGNAGDLRTWQHIATDFAGLGCNFFIIDYRGYGKSTGTISEAGLYMDADAAYDYLIGRGFTPEQIIVYGRSIGTGVAADLASRRVCKGLILESPYTSMTALAGEKFPVLLPALILTYRLNTSDKLANVTAPVVFIHGMADGLIPPSHTETLYRQHAGRKLKILIPGATHNHANDFDTYRNAMVWMLE